MNGPDHYREAERLLPIAHDLADQDQQVRADFIVARAQVHATLALTAAQVDTTDPHVSPEASIAREWIEALS